MKEAEILKTDNQTKCDSNVCEVGWEEGDEDNDEKKGNDEKMHCIGSLVMPPSANLVNAGISDTDWHVFQFLHTIRFASNTL